MKVQFIVWTHIFRPNFAAAWMNLGIVLAGLKHHSEAEASYFTALSYRKKYPDCYYNLGNLVSVKVFVCTNLSVL